MYRFKGLGEMDAKELFETTMDPANRKLLRIDLTDAVEAEEMFVRLMGGVFETIMKRCHRICAGGPSV